MRVRLDGAGGGRGKCLREPHSRPAVFAWYYPPGDRPPYYLWWIAGMGVAALVIGVLLWVILSPAGLEGEGLGIFFVGLIQLGIAGALALLEYRWAAPKTVRSEAARNATIALIPVLILVIAAVTVSVETTGSTLPPVAHATIRVSETVWEVTNTSSTNCNIGTVINSGFSAPAGGRATVSASIPVSGSSGCPGFLVQEAVIAGGVSILHSDLPLFFTPGGTNEVTIEIQFPPVAATEALFVLLVAD